jgi:hypothetical protein
MHWCMDETLAVLAMIPFIGIFFGKMHTWWHKHFHHKCHEDGCKAEHVEHCKMPAHIPITIEKGEENWDSIVEDDVEERFGEDLLMNLMVEVMVSPIEYPQGEEAHWFVNSDSSAIMVHIKERVFLCNVASEKRWTELLQ